MGCAKQGVIHCALKRVPSFERAGGWASISGVAEVLPGSESALTCGGLREVSNCNPNQLLKKPHKAAVRLISRKLPPITQLQTDHCRRERVLSALILPWLSGLLLLYLVLLFDGLYEMNNCLFILVGKSGYHLQLA